MRHPFMRSPEQTSQLYTIAGEPESLPSAVKVEADNDGFIQDISHQIGASPPAPFEHLVPPTEVPLRATGASKEMRKMMGVFRLDPFSIHHSGGRGVSGPLWNGGEAGPLTEPPRYIEYQLNGYYSSEESDIGSHGGSPEPSLRILDGDEGSLSPCTRSDENFNSFSRWQEPDWGIHAGSHSLSLYMSGFPEFDYAAETSMHISSSAYGDLQSDHPDSFYSRYALQYSTAPCSPSHSQSSQTDHSASSSTYLLSPSQQNIHQQPMNVNSSFMDYGRDRMLRHKNNSHGHLSPHSHDGQPSHLPSFPPSMAGQRDDMQQIWGPRPVWPFSRSTRDQAMACRPSFGGTELHNLSG